MSEGRERGTREGVDTGRTVAGMSTDERKAPKAGASIQVASEPWGRVSGEWYPATVTAVDDATGLISASVELPAYTDVDGEHPASTTTVGIAGESDQWRHPAK